MATIKAYTDLEQSRELAKFLSHDSADMFYSDIFTDEKHKYNFHYLETYGFKTFEDTKLKESKHLSFIPCWGQSALYNILPVVIGNILEKNALRLRLDKGETDFAVWYENIDTHYVEDGLDVVESNPVDAYFQMIVKLHERGLLSK